MRSAFFTLLLFLLGLSSEALGQSPVWLQTNGPRDANGVSILVSPSGKIFVVSDGLVITSSDKGNTWHEVATEVTSRGGAIYINPITKSLFLLPIAGWSYRDTVVGQIRDLWKSTDDGVTWTKTFASTHTFSLGVSEVGAKGALYLAGFDGTHSFYWKSTDDGITWDSSFINGPTEIEHFTATKKGTLIADDYRSTNDGLSWAKITLNSKINITAESSSNKLYGFDLYSQYTSTNEGRDWKEVSSCYGPAAINKNGIVAIAMDPRRGFACLLDSNDSGIPTVGSRVGDQFYFGAVASAPDGSFYLTKENELFHLDLSQDSVWHQIQLPGSVVRSLVVRSNTVTALTDAKKLWQSSDQGRHWSLLSGAQVLAMDSSGNLHSKAYDGSANSMAIARDGTLYTASASDGVWRSTDNGASWDQLNAGRGTDVSTYSIVVNATGNVFIGSDTAIYRSTDKAITWQTLPTGFGSRGISISAFSTAGRVRALIVDIHGNLIAGLDSVGVFRSTDDGASWQQLGQAGLTNTYINDILSTHAKPLLVCTQDGVFEYNEPTNSWNDVSNGLTNRNATALAPGYVGTAGTGVFIEASIAGVSNRHQLVPADSFLEQNYPNPFNPSTHISFILSHASNVSVSVYNAVGQLVRLATNGWYSSGPHEITFDARDLPSGVYSYRLEVGGKSVIKQMVLEK